ncbi:MAG TPA: Fe-S cluster assembly protein SufD [Bacteroidetes bacterium]|nr:Fe-S cluster assembly protein SufD [Bacteroidota bacterium]
MDSEKKDIREWYQTAFADFENSLNGGASLPFHAVRKKAIARFAELGFPSTRNEDWKYTNIAPLLKHQFQPVAEAPDIAAESLAPFLFKGLDADRLVFVNGVYNEALSSVSNLPDGVILDTLENAFTTHADTVTQALGKTVSYEEETFSALNTAFARTGVFLSVPAGVVLERPLYILHVSKTEGREFLAAPRNLFLFGDNSQARLVEGHYNLDGGTSFKNSVTEISVGADALVEHVRIQDESKDAFHFATTQVEQATGSNYTSVAIDLGGSLVRNNLNVHLAEERCEAHLIGFYFGSGRQLIDNHTMIDHAVPNCESNELYKGILDDRAHGVFNGKVMVRPDAQKTNAFQQNQAILLSDDAHIDSKPQLEIFADDVKCSHGATVGELDDESLFYLRARGIGEQEAHAMLRLAFARDIFNYIKIDAVRERLEELVVERFNNKA